MAETRIRLRLIIAVFTLACLSAVLSTALLVSHFLLKNYDVLAQTAPDFLGAIENDLQAGKTGLAWDKFSVLAQKKKFVYGTRGIALLWHTWLKEPRIPDLRDISAHIYENGGSENDRRALSYLLLEANQADVAIRFSPPGTWNAQPALEAELALYRSQQSPIRFAALDKSLFSDDTRVELDRALAWGYLGDFAAARESAQTVIEQTDPPGHNGGTGLIDLSRGLCRRQAARMAQIMSVWDSADPHFEPLMHTAMVELMVDPNGLAKVTPDYFDILLDVAAWTGDLPRYLSLLRVASAESHPLSVQHRENQALVEHDPSLRPELYADERRLLATAKAGDPRGLIPELGNAAAKHDDDRSWRLLAWFLQKTNDQDGLARLLDREMISHGPWHNFYDAVSAEKAGDLQSAHELFQKSRHGALANAAMLNQARVLLRQGRIEDAASLAALSRQGIEVRSLGLSHDQNSAYSLLYADALALQSRILSAQGRDTDAQQILRQLEKIQPDHPELYQAKGLPVQAPNDSEIQ